MARPTKPKDVKPKAVEAEPGAAPKALPGTTESHFDIKFIVTIIVILVAGLGGSVASTLYLAPMVLVPQIVDQVLAATHKGQEGDEGGEAAGPNRKLGMNLELDEFTVNLKIDPTEGGNQFLRTKMSLSVAVPSAEYCGETPTEKHARVPLPEPLETADAGRSGYPGVLAGAAAMIDSSDSAALLASGGGEEAEGGEGGGGDAYTACQKAFNQNMARYVPTMRDIINQALMKRTAGTLASIEGQEALKDEIKTEINTLMAERYSIIRVNFSDFIIQH